MNLQLIMKHVSTLTTKPPQIADMFHSAADTTASGCYLTELFYEVPLSFPHLSYALFALSSPLPCIRCWLVINEQKGQSLPKTAKPENTYEYGAKQFRGRMFHPQCYIPKPKSEKLQPYTPPPPPPLAKKKSKKQHAKP